MYSKTFIMGFRSFMYRSGWFYNAITRRLYDQDTKFLAIAKLIGKGPKKVLDFPCGTGYLMRFLDSSIEYQGVDLNRRFLNRIKKKELIKRGIKLNKVLLRQIDIFDFQHYKGEKIDVIVICDILHHVFPNHIELINIAKQISRKIIVCEPFVINPKEISARDKLFKIVIFLGKYLPKPLLKIIDYFLLDNDGINSYYRRLQWNLDKNSLKDFYKNMGFTNTYKILDEYIAVWESEITKEGCI
jgi:SAM-dependent methyltransferase